MNFALWQRRSPVTPLSRSVRAHLTAQRGLSEKDAGSLRMMEHHGQFSGRKVTYFRVFDPDAVQRAGIDVRHYGDLDAYRLLRLHAGHVESDGQIVLNLQEAAPARS